MYINKLNREALSVSTPLAELLRRLTRSCDDISETIKYADLKKLYGDKKKNTCLLKEVEKLKAL